MGKIIEFKKHNQQSEELSLETDSDNVLLERVYDFDCPIPLYSDEDGQLFTVFYNLANEETLIIPYFDNIESMVEYEKKKNQIINITSSKLY